MHAAHISAYPEREEDIKNPFDAAEIARFHNRHKPGRCFIVGNGPSLNDTDLTLLTDEITFGVNGIFYKTDETGFRPTYYVVEDSHFMNDNLERIKKYRTGHAFFPSIYRPRIPKKTGASFFRMNRGFYETRSPNYGIPRFSVDCAQRIFCGQTVSYICMQLAFYMGFAEVYLVGFDFSYEIPESALVRGLSITSTEDDPNHFHKDYFGKGKKWHDPQLDKVRRSYIFADLVFTWHDRKIVNATSGGQLEVFERCHYKSLFTHSGNPALSCT